MPTKQIEILMVDLNPLPVSCPRDRCAGLPELLINSIPGEVHLQTITTLSSTNQISKLPDLIFLRPSTTKLLSDTVTVLRNEWNRSPILCLFYSEWQGVKEIFRGLQNGLEDYLTCPFREIDLFPRIQRIIFLKNGLLFSSKTEMVKTRLHLDSLESLVGESKSFLRVVEKIPVLADADATLLISGETGTGKELFARAIHYQSKRQDKPFVPMNCGAIPDHLFENELFGHAKGAYTDASSSEKGLIAEAEGGTLFLDEVDALSPSAQVKLLRFLQDRRYRQLGCSKNIEADVRIIAATNSNIKQLVREKRLREDLYHRLNILFLEIPPLRERMDDLPLLVNHFLVIYGAKCGMESHHLSPEALEKLLEYSWPGNIRELEGVIQRSTLLTTSSIIKPIDISLSLGSHEEISGERDLTSVKSRTIEQLERAYLVDILSRHNGNITYAAKAAGKDRRTIQRLLKKYGLYRQDFLRQK